MKKQARKGASSAEVGILIGISVLVVALGAMIFYNNVQNAAINSGMNKKITAQAGGGTTTAYTAENRDYASSQIDVQTMGAQGLEMLRRKANNMAIDIIEKTTAKEEANDIAYLSKALEIITGETDICTYMKEDTDKHCDEFSKSKYKNTLGSSITIQPTSGERTNSGVYNDVPSSLNNNGSKKRSSTNTSPFGLGEGGSWAYAGYTATTQTFPLTSTVANAITMTVYKNDNGYPSSTTEEKISAIVALTKAVYKDISKNVVLIDVDIEAEYNSGSGYKSQVLKSLQALYNRMYTLWDTCEFNDAGVAQSAECVPVSSDDEYANNLKESQYNEFLSWYEKLTKEINGLSSDEEIARAITSAYANSNIKSLVEKDVYQVGDTDYYTTSAPYLMSNILNDAKAMLPQSEAQDAQQLVAPTAQKQVSFVGKLIGTNLGSKIYEGVVGIGQEFSEWFDHTGPLVRETAAKCVYRGFSAVNKVANIIDSDMFVLDKCVSATMSITIGIGDVSKSIQQGLSQGLKETHKNYADQPVKRIAMEAALVTAKVAVAVATPVVQAVNVIVTPVATLVTCAAKAVVSGVKAAVKNVGSFFKKLFG